MIKAFLNRPGTYSKSVKQPIFGIGAIPVTCSTGNVTVSNHLPIDDKFRYTTENLRAQLEEGILLTNLSMAASEASFARDWENEDDEKWNKFLNDE